MDGRAAVKDNVAHFAAGRGRGLVFVPKPKLPAGDGQAASLTDGV